MALLAIQLKRPSLSQQWVHPVCQRHLTLLYLHWQESEAELKVKQLLKLNRHQQGHLGHKLPPLLQRSGLTQDYLWPLGWATTVRLAQLVINLTLEKQRSAARTGRGHCGCSEQRGQNVFLNPLNLQLQVQILMLADCPRLILIY